MLVLDRPHDYPWFKRTLLAGPYLASIRDADVLLCVSEATRMRLLRHVPEAASRVRVVPHAVSPTLHRVLPEPVAALEGRPFGLVVGDSSRRKNLGFVLELWRRVSAQQPAAVLAVVGPEGWGISDLGAGGDAATRTDVALLGHLPEEQLRWCYQNAEVVLCPSLVEGFGLPALEALEFGATVVTSTDPALVEVSGDRALHLPADDAGPWVRAILGAFSGSGSRPTHCGARRTWDRVAAETVQAVRDSS
jgi:glycosyltransferase involved in cell wall biosynthesis